MARKSGFILFIKKNYHKNTKYQKVSLFTYFSAVSFYFITIHLYKFHSVLNCIKNSYPRMLTKLPKIAKITLFLGLCIPSLLFRFGDIGKKTGPKYSSLTFCHWNLNGLIDKYKRKMKIRLEKPALNNFKAYGWQKSLDGGL